MIRIYLVLFISILVYSCNYKNSPIPPPMHPYFYQLTDIEYKQESIIEYRILADKSTYLQKALHFNRRNLYPRKILGDKYQEPINYSNCDSCDLRLVLFNEGYYQSIMCKYCSYNKNFVHLLIPKDRMDEELGNIELEPGHKALINSFNIKVYIDTISEPQVLQLTHKDTTNGWVDLLVFGLDSTYMDSINRHTIDKPLSPFKEKIVIETIWKEIGRGGIIFDKKQIQTYKLIDLGTWYKGDIHKHKIDFDYSLNGVYDDYLDYLYQKIW